MPSTIQFDKIGKLGFGYMRLPFHDGAYDPALTSKMADAFLESGGTYFDTAFIYDESEEILRDTVIKRYPNDRGKIQIATKVSMFRANTPELVKQHFDISLERLGTDYIDFYLLHGIDSKSSKKAEEFGAWEFLKELKVKGLVKHLGFSFHGAPEELDEILGKHPETEAVQLQINYLDWDDPKVQSRRLHETARKYDVPVIIMEPLRGGLLASADSPIVGLLHEANPNVSTASWAMRFASQLDGVFVALSGMSSPEQMADNIKTYEKLEPLSADEMKIIKKAVEILNSVPRIDCTSCRYCINECPSKIPITFIMQLYNDYLVHKSAINLDRPYGLSTRGGGKASTCTACKACEEICPQKIKIVDIISVAASLFDDNPSFPTFN